MSTFRFLFSWKGRVGVKGFALGLALIAIGIFCLIWVNSKLESGVELKIMCSAVLAISFMSFCVRRTHDLGEKVKVEVQFVSIPIIDSIRSIGKIIRLLTEPGDKNINQYGHPPKF